MYREKHNSYFNITTTEKIDNSNEYDKKVDKNADYEYSWFFRAFVLFLFYYAITRL